MVFNVLQSTVLTLSINHSAFQKTTKLVTETMASYAIIQEIKHGAT